MAEKTMTDIVYMNISDLTELDSTKPGTFAAVETDKQGKKFDISTFATKTEVNAGLAEKQDTISDLEDIRSGAAAGATAYNKPAEGIPASDLATTVQSSLDKANIALTTENIGEYSPVYLNGNELWVNVGTGGLHITGDGDIVMDVPVYSNKGNDGDIMALRHTDAGYFVEPKSPATIAETLVDDNTTTVDQEGKIVVKYNKYRGITDNNGIGIRIAEGLDFNGTGELTIKYNEYRGLKFDYSSGIFVDIADDGGLGFNGTGALKIQHQVPDPTRGNNGQVLTISSDDIVWADIPSPIPAYTAEDAGKVLAVNSDGTGLEWKTLPTSN